MTSRAHGLATRQSAMLIVLILNIGLATCNLTDMFRTSCPYSNFCTANSSASLSPSSPYESCCLDCFCDKDCVLFGDCCPDIEGNAPRRTETVVTPLTCIPSVVENDFYEEGNVHLYDIPYFRIIDFCPVDNIVEKCAGNFDDVPDFDDMVVVADRKSGTPYKNKYCAQCHGVSDTVRWDLAIIDCHESLVESQLLAEDVYPYLFDNCMLASTPSDVVPRNSRSTNCHYYIQCSEEDNADEDIVDGCTNGPIMPYRHTNEVDLYKNVLCYQCRYGHGVRSKCQKTDDDSRTAGFGMSFNFLLSGFRSTDDTSSIRTNHKCSNYERFDPLKRQCRRVYCPPLEALSYGECVTIAIPVRGVHVKLLYVPVDDVTIDEQLNGALYNMSVAYHYMKSSNRRVGNKRCGYGLFIADVFYHSDSKMLAYLSVRIIYDVDDNCTMQYIRSMLQQSSTIHEKWLINGGQFVDMKGKVTFFYSNQPESTDTRLSSFKLIDQLTSSAPNAAVQPFFLCPYYVLELAEYNLLEEQFGMRRLNDTLTTLTANTDTMKGYYQLTENEVAVCIPPESTSLGSHGIRTRGNHVIQSLVYILVIIEIVENWF